MADPLAPLLRGQSQWLRHIPGCPRAGQDDFRCTCGLDAALAEVRASVPTLSDEERATVESFRRWVQTCWVKHQPVELHVDVAQNLVHIFAARFPDLGDQDG